MNNRCAICNEDFRKQPGYYFGAAYVSYGIMVGFGIGLFALLYWVFNVSEYVFFGIFFTLLILLLPLSFRISRLVWINFFVTYKEKDKI